MPNQASTRATLKHQTVVDRPCGQKDLRREDRGERKDRQMMEACEQPVDEHFPSTDSVLNRNRARPNAASNLAGTSVDFDPGSAYRGASLQRG